MKYKIHHKAKVLPLLLVTLLGMLTSINSINLNAQLLNTGMDNYYGKTKVPVNEKTKSPKTPAVDAFGSELYIEGRTDVALDGKSIAAQNLQEKEEAVTREKQLDKSIRTDISSGEPVLVLIAPEHFTQLSFMKNGELVYPRRAFTGQPDLLVIDKKENSPYVYIAASAMVEGQTTNLFVETEEDGKIQTYVVDLMVTQPKNIRAQVSINLVDDKTPAIRGGVGSEEEADTKNTMGPVNQGQTSVSNPSPTGNTTSPADKVVGISVSGKFTEIEVQKYFNTMIEMAGHYPEAKQLEKKTGRTIYRDTDVRIFPSGKNNYIDPIENTIWEVDQVWFFPKYDAILLDVRVKNPTSKISSWDFSQVRWQANNSPKNFSSTAAAPISMQTLPDRTNQIWYLVQGNRIDPSAEFSPIFPRAERRGNQTQSQNSIQPAPIPNPEPPHKTKTKRETTKSNLDDKDIKK